MKKRQIYVLAALVILATVGILYSCIKPDPDKNPKVLTEPRALNLSVYLDLSDRLTRDLTPTQFERDTAIINKLIEIFIEDCKKNGKIIKSENHFQIFFYPHPKNSEIASLASGLNVDLSKIDIREKKYKLSTMKEQFDTSLTQIYKDILNEKHWIGSDIWGFFNYKEVDKLCIRKDYRNILVILTDGFLYHKENQQKEGNSYSYVLPQTLEVPNSKIMVKRNGLSNLEVLMLEVNPYNKSQQDKLIPVLEEWFKEMGVSKFVVSNTDLPSTTAITIDSFFTNEN